jgi:hypothetical protein
VRRFRHMARGTTYQMIGRARMQVSDAKLTTSSLLGKREIDLSQFFERISFVVYRAEVDDTLWVRPESEFFDGRFEEIKS